MSIILSLLPSGTLVQTLQEECVADMGLTIAPSGTATVTQEVVDIMFEKSVRRINRILGLATEIAGGDLVPRPSEGVLDLIILQCECLMTKRLNEESKISPEVKRIRLDVIELEFADVSSLKSKDLDAKFGFCAELEKALLDYRSDDAMVNGADIIWDGTTRRFEDVDYDGTDSGRIYNPNSRSGENKNWNDDADNRDNFADGR